MASKTSMITTGVDRLVDLIERKKEISIDDAAKELSVAKVVVEEWANFLEEADIIKVEFKFATPYLYKKEISEKELGKKVKEFHGRKEGFIRKIETTLQFIERESIGMKELKDEFSKLSKDVEIDVEKVKKDLETLERYDSLKRGIDKEIISQQHAFQEKIEDINRQILKEKQRYSKLIEHIKTEELRLEKEKLKAEMLEKNEEILKKKVDNIMKSVDIIKAEISAGRRMVEEDISYIENLRISTKRMEEDFENRKAEMTPLLLESKKKEEEIETLQNNILESVAVKKKHIKEGMKESQKVKRKFKKFFDRKVKISRLVDKIDFDLMQLESSLKSLIKEAEIIELSSRSKSVKQYIMDLEKKFKDINRKKGIFEREIFRLGRLIGR